MANIDDPKGFIPYQQEGKVVRTRDYPVTTATTIYPGDPLKRVAAGTVEPYTNGDTEPVVGIAAQYSASGSDDDIAVYDDPEQTYRVQCADTFALADRGSNVDVDGSPSPDTSLLTSGYEISMATAATTATLPFKVLDLAPVINQEDNNAGEANADILVKINRSERGNLQTGI